MLRWQEAKDPDRDPLDYSVDWTDWLDGDTIAASTWSFPDGVTRDAGKGDGKNDANTITVIWIDGGAAGKTYDLVNSIVTAAGRQTERTVRLKVNNR